MVYIIVLTTDSKLIVDTLGYCPTHLLVPAWLCTCLGSYDLLAVLLTVAMYMLECSVYI